MSAYQSLVALLPSGQAWATSVERRLTQFLRGLTDDLTGSIDRADLVYLDTLPGSTRQLAELEAQYGLEAVDGMTAADRQRRIGGAMAGGGDHGPDSVAGELVSAGFAVTAHPWWTETAWGEPRALDPRDYFTAVYGGRAIDGHLLGAVVLESKKYGEPGAGHSAMAADNPEAVAGHYGGYDISTIVSSYEGPAELHPFYVYLGGATFPDLIDIPAARRLEFESDVRAVVPQHLMIVLRVRYI